ncbi:hypothetical protein A2U01_0066335, partial [Trifolium medium]|nr:hypothetical protein [Trifolium medium]
MEVEVEVEGGCMLWLWCLMMKCDDDYGDNG